MESSLEYSLIDPFWLHWTNHSLVFLVVTRSDQSTVATCHSFVVKLWQGVRGVGIVNRTLNTRLIGVEMGTWELGVIRVLGEQGNLGFGGNYGAGWIFNINLTEVKIGLESRFIGWALRLYVGLDTTMDQACVVCNIFKIDVIKITRTNYVNTET